MGISAKHNKTSLEIAFSVGNNNGFTYYYFFVLYAFYTCLSNVLYIKSSFAKTDKNHVFSLCIPVKLNQTAAGLLSKNKQNTAK